MSLLSRRSLRWSCLASVFALLAASCGGEGPTDTADGEAAPGSLAAIDVTTTTEQSPMDKIVVAARGSIDASPLWVADSQGFFEAQNLEIDFSPVREEIALFNSVASGEAQVAVVSAGTAVRRVAFNKANLTLTSYLDGTQGGREEPRGTMSLVAATPGLRSGCDLELMRIGVDSLASLTAVSVREMVSRDGCDPDVVSFVEADSATHLEALEAGNLDAAALLDPYTSRALRAEHEIIANLDNELCPDYGRCPISIVVSDTAWAEANPDVVARFQRALDEAMFWIRSNEIAYRAELVTCCALTANDASDVRVPNFVGKRRNLRSDMRRLVEILVAQGQVDAGAMEEQLAR